jgi:catechol 2,3-dioxygenase-like lactoylglutathione lyase family enzyme
MLGTLDHIGYLVHDLEAGIAEFCARLGIEQVKRFERAQLELIGAYLGPGNGNIELFSFTDPRLQSERLGTAEIALDHVAYEVADIAATEARMRAAGVRFCGPDQREEFSEPIDLGGVLHLWTVRETTCGQSIQLLQRPAPA